jgi:hypothetical protein
MAKKYQAKAGQCAVLLARLAQLEDELGEHDTILCEYSTQSSCHSDNGQPEDKDTDSDDDWEAQNRGTTVALKKGAVSVHWL